MARTIERTRPSAGAPDTTEAPVTGNLSEDGTRVAPTRNRAAAAAGNTRRPAAKGWTAYKQNKASKAGFTQNLKVPENEEILIAFLEAEPFISFKRHWLRNIKGRQTFACLDPDPCPICDIGDRAGFVTCMNVAEIEAGAAPVHRVWEMSPGPADVVSAKADNPKFSPLNKEGMYWAVSKTKQSNGFFGYSLTPVKARDLEDDWEGFAPVTAAEMTELLKDLAGDDYVKYDEEEFLREIVKGLPQED